MKVYLSAAFDHGDLIANVARQMEAAGYTVTSNWLREPPLAYTDTDHEQWERRARANDDMADIRRADTLVYFTLWPSTTGGRHVELGLALAWEKRIIRVGPPDNMFAHLSTIEEYAGLSDFMQAVKEKRL